MRGGFNHFIGIRLYQNHNDTDNVNLYNRIHMHSFQQQILLFWGDKTLCLSQIVLLKNDIFHNYILLYKM